MNYNELLNKMSSKMASASSQVGSSRTTNNAA
jgi:hypothetical protein